MIGRDSNGSVRITWSTGLAVMNIVGLIAGGAIAYGRLTAHIEETRRQFEEHVREERIARQDFVASKLYDAELKAVNRRLDDLIVLARQTARDAAR